MKTVVICGKFATGADDLVETLESFGYDRIPTYTTRQRRPDEDENAHIFVTSEYFFELWNNNLLQEVSVENLGSGPVYYGCSRTALTEVINENSNGKVVKLNPYGVKKFKDDGVDCFVVYLNASRDYCISSALKQGWKFPDIIARINSDEPQFNMFEMQGLYDYTITVSNTSNNATYQMLVLLQKLNGGVEWKNVTLPGGNNK